MDAGANVAPRVKNNLPQVRIIGNNNIEHVKVNMLFWKIVYNLTYIIDSNVKTPIYNGIPYVTIMWNKFIISMFIFNIILDWCIRIVYSIEYE